MANFFGELKSYGKVNYTLEVLTGELIQSIVENNYSNIDLQIVFDDVSKLNPDIDYLSSFYDAWQKHYPNTKLREVFRTIETKDLIKPGSTDENVLEVLRNLRKEAFDETIEILTKRIERFGINKYHISRLKGDLINIQLPLIKDSLRLKSIIQENALVEFWETYNFSNPKIYRFVLAADSISVNAKGDSTEEKDRLFRYFRPNFYHDAEGMFRPQTSSVMGYALIKDTALVNAILKKPEIISLYPRNIKLLWGFAPPKYLSGASAEALELYIIKLTRRDGEAPLSGEHIQKATAVHSNGDILEIRLLFDESGARIWKNITRQNISKSIAITINRKVYLASVVQSEISKGKTSIVNNFTWNEASDLANILSSGILPLGIQIVDVEYNK